MPYNDSFYPTAATVNASLIDPFGLEITGTIVGEFVATVDDPAADPLTGGMFGTISESSQMYPGGLVELGQYARSLATNPIAVALALIAPGVTAQDS